MNKIKDKIKKDKAMLNFHKNKNKKNIMNNK